jgi:hypothetical protein
MSRQLIFALQRVEADPGIKDCGTQRFLTLKVDNDVASKIEGRYISINGEPLVLFNKQKHMNKVINLRTPMYCLSNRRCRTCYGELLERNKTHYVGILAGQILGESLTQTIMRTFHMGGAVSIKTVNIINELTKILSDNEKKIFNNNFYQEKSSLFSKNEKGKIILNFDVYKNPKKEIIIGKDFIDLDYGYFKIVIKDYEFDSAIDNKIKINLKDKKIIEKKNGIEILFSENDEIFNCLPEGI